MLVLNGTDGIDKVQDNAVNPVTDIASGIPCFSAYQSVGQSLSTSTWTKINFQVKEFDTTNAYDTTTMRFTPQVAGYYKVVMSMYSPSILTQIQTGLYKNDSAYKYGNASPATGTSSTVSQAAIVYLNGSTDYIEPFGFIAGTSPATGASSTTTYFQAHLIVGA